MERRGDKMKNNKDGGRDEGKSAAQRDAEIRSRTARMEAIVRQSDVLDQRKVLLERDFREAWRAEETNRDVLLEALKERYGKEAVKTARKYIDQLGEHPSEPQSLQGESARALNEVRAIIESFRKKIVRLEQDHKSNLTQLMGERSQLENQYESHFGEINRIVEEYSEEAPSSDRNNVHRW